MKQIGPRLATPVGHQNQVWFVGPNIVMMERRFGFSSAAGSGSGGSGPTIRSLWTESRPGQRVTRLAESEAAFLSFWGAR